MVARLGARQGQDGRRKEHGLVVWVRDEQADALVLQRGEARLDDADGVHVEHGHQKGDGGEEEEGRVHGAACARAASNLVSPSCVFWSLQALRSELWCRRAGARRGAIALAGEGGQVLCANKARRWQHRRRWWVE